MHHMELVGDHRCRRACRATRAISSALPQLLRFMSEIAGGAAAVGLEQSAEPIGAVQAERDLGLHVGELLLHELVRGRGRPNCLAIEHVLPRAVPAVLGGAHRAQTMP